MIVKAKRHPRQSVLLPWLLIGISLGMGLVALQILGLLPLAWAVGPVPPKASLALLVSLLAGMALALPLAIWQANPGRAAQILRPTAGKLLASFGLSFAIPGALTASGVPLPLIPLYLLVAFNAPGLGPVLRLVVAMAAVWLALYPLVAALLWGLPWRWRLPALCLPPLAAGLLLWLAGGSF